MFSSFIQRLPLLAGIAFAGVATSALAEAQSDAAARIAVNWTNPEDFSDVRQNPGAGLGSPTPNAWLPQLARHLQTRADRVLAPGEHLDVTFTNIKRAGSFEPWRGPLWDDVRVVKDLYPPQIDLRFTLTGTDGATLREGERTLRDPSFLHRGTLSQDDPLRFEKRMLDDWLRREFATAAKTQE
jgi:hypothetical protein